jgi:hypothetical protein
MGFGRQVSVEKVDPGIGPCRLTGQFHLHEAFEQRPELAPGPDQGMHLRRPLDVGQLGDISRDEVRNAGVKETFPAPHVGAGYCLGEASADDPLGVFGTEDRRFVPKFFALGEDRIDETIRRLVDLALLPAQRHLLKDQSAVS